MRNLFFKLFSDTPFGASATIESFDIWHILYLIAIFGLITLAAFIFKNKKLETKEKVLRVLAAVLLFSYLTDYFVHDFVYADYVETTGEYVRGGLNMDKLPFHICTVMCPILLFTTYNKKLHKFLEPVAAIAITAPMMYLVYPSTGVGGEPWCYRVVQTMFFHGVEMAWGILAVAMGLTKLEWKNVWKAEILLIGITLWAKLGVTMLEYNWFFLESNPFGIEALDKPWLLPIVVPTAIFAITASVYGVKTGIAALCKKFNIDNSSAEVVPFEKTETPALAEVAATEETNE